MLSLRPLILVAFIAFLAPARAQVTEIWKCTEANGRPLYTSDKRETVGKKCELVSREVNVVSTPPTPGASKGAPKSPGSFPKESPVERANARERQRDILQKELATEQGLLVK